MEEQNTQSQQSVKETTSEPSVVATKSMTPALFAGGLIIGLVLVGGYWFMHNGSDTPALRSDVESPVAAEPVADDAVVAQVNGVELSGKVLNQQISLLAQQSGILDPTALDSTMYEQLQSQALDSLINTELLLQDAKSSGLTVAPEAVDARYIEIIATLGEDMSAEERLAELNITVDEFKATLVNDLLIEAYFEQDESLTVSVTDEEVQALYEQVSSQQAGDAPPLAEVQFQIEQQIEFQKQQQVVGVRLGELREAADIEVAL